MVLDIFSLLSCCWVGTIWDAPLQVSFVWVKSSGPQEAEREFPFHTWLKLQIGLAHPTETFQWPTLCQVDSIMREEKQYVATHLYFKHLAESEWVIQNEKTRINHHILIPSGLIKRTSCKMLKHFRAIQEPLNPGSIAVFKRDYVPAELQCYFTCCATSMHSPFSGIRFHWCKAKYIGRWTEMHKLKQHYSDARVKGSWNGEVEGH